MCKTDPVHDATLEVDVENLLTLFSCHIEIVKDNILQFKIAEVKISQVYVRKVDTLYFLVAAFQKSFKVLQVINHFQIVCFHERDIIVGVCRYFHDDRDVCRLGVCKNSKKSVSRQMIADRCRTGDGYRDVL